jgi:hypothetical protein
MVIITTTAATRQPDMFPLLAPNSDWERERRVEWEGAGVCIREYGTKCKKPRCHPPPSPNYHALFFHWFRRRLLKHRSCPRLYCQGIGLLINSLRSWPGEVYCLQVGLQSCKALKVLCYLGIGLPRQFEVGLKGLSHERDWLKVMLLDRSVPGEELLVVFKILKWSFDF